MRLLAACAFAEVARTGSRDLLDDTDEDKADWQEGIHQIPEYQHAVWMELLDTFDIHILDKMEGVLKGDLSTSRRYA